MSYSAESEPSATTPVEGQGSEQRMWPAGETSQIPYWVYTDPAIYSRERDRIFGGPSWNYVSLSAELCKPGDFKRTSIGDHPVVVVRDEHDQVNVVSNRCAHRGLMFCMEPSGNVSRFICPYHQWSYDLRGDLRGVPFRHGARGRGGLPRDFDMTAHGLRRLAVAERNGVVFASLDPAPPPLAEYLGEPMIHYFDRVFDGRQLRVLGYQRQRIPANWKLIVENIKDPYHATLLHVFLVSLGLFRADQQSQVLMDVTGGHSALVSRRGDRKPNKATAEIRRLNESLELQDPNLLVPAKEFPGEATVVMQTVWPNLMIQQQTNTLAMRQIVPREPGVTDLHWTYFGYADDDEEMTLRRLRQANLQGPAGLIGIDDWEVLSYNQAGLASAADDVAIVEMGGRGVDNADHMVTEAAIRAFYVHYRRVMGL